MVRPESLSRNTRCPPKSVSYGLNHYVSHNSMGIYRPVCYLDSSGFNALAKRTERAANTTNVHPIQTKDSVPATDRAASDRGMISPYPIVVAVTSEKYRNESNSGAVGIPANAVAPSILQIAP